jgi:hypothetical protein
MQRVDGWPIRAAGAAAIVVFFAFIAQFWHPVWGFTAFLRLDPTNDNVKIAAFKVQPVYVYPEPGGYDGLFYAQLAYDPLLRTAETRRAMDNPIYRARRILLPALAWLLVLGQPFWIVHVYSVLNIVAWLALATVLWRLLPVRDLRSWLAWAGVLFSTGTIASVRLALTDLAALALLAGAMLAVERARGLSARGERHRGLLTAAGLVGAAGLARETSLLAIVGVLGRPWLSRANVLRVAIALLPLILWLTYVRWLLGPGDAGWSNLTRPLAGLAGKLSADVSAARHLGDRPLALTTMAATLGLVAQAVYVAMHPRLDDRWWRVGAVYVLLMLCLNHQVWEGFPGAATRVLLPMTLAFNVLAIRKRAAAAWLIAGNLAVLNGYLVMRDVPHDTRELAAGHAGAAAVIARTDRRWFDVERGRRHATAWSSAESAVELETWPHDERTIELNASVRSRQRLVLTVAQNGVVLWRNTIFERPLRIALPCQVRDGRARIDFSAGAPGASPGTDAPERTPLFAVEDMQFTLPR